MKNLEATDVIVTFDEARVMLTYWTQALARTYCWPWKEKPDDTFLPLYEEEYCKARVSYWAAVVDPLREIFHEQDKRDNKKSIKIAGSSR